MASTTVVATLLFFVGAASGHIRMTQPIPYGTPDTSPLQASGSDYPCKLQQVDGFNAPTVTDLHVGSTFHVAFYGTAVHNGGSCQFSLTKDRQPSANSSFKTIYSILGGCPGLNGQTTTYDIPVPSEVPNGDYSLSWSWYNNIGNRELYMNCAPVRVSGSSASDSDFESLPNMALYNLADYNTCKTVESYDVEFPSAGKYVEKGITYKPMAPAGCGSYKGTNVDAGAPPSNNPQASGSGTNPGSAGATSSTGSNLPVSASSVAGGHSGLHTSTIIEPPRPAETQLATPSVTVPGLMTILTTSATGAAPSNVSSTTVTTSMTGVSSSEASLANIAPIPSAPTASVTSSALVQAAPSSPPATNSSGAGSSSGSSIGVPCPPDRAIVCASDGTQFGLCNFGTAIMQPVAAGTRCFNGQIIKRSAKFGVNF